MLPTNCPHTGRFISLVLAWFVLASSSEAQTAAAAGASGRPPVVTANQQIERDGTIRSLYNVRDRARPGVPEQAAREYLAQRKLVPATGSSALVTEETHASETGYHVRFIQTVQGIPVHRGSMTVSLTRDRSVTMVVNNTLQGIQVEMPATILAFDNAMDIARRAVSADDRPLGVEDAARLMIYRTSDGRDRVAYRVTMVRSSGDWEVFVDAASGAVLGLQDQFVHLGNSAGGFAYRSDPLSAARQRYGAPGFADGGNITTDSLDFYRTRVTLDSLEVYDGFVWLRGPDCEITDIEAPADSAYRASAADGFFFDRSQPGFEAVNAYYHAGLVMSRLRRLGIRWPAASRLRIDPHGCSGKDDSHYSPTGHWITFGTGGVDDAEDADVLWHEMAHAVQYSLIPGWGGGECGALGEGFADYWAASYSRSLGEWQTSDPEYHWLFNWDGHNPFWNGRITNDPRSYPFGTVGVHEAGQIWNSALVGILGDLGRDVTDRLVLHSFAYLGPGVTATDNAQAILQADRDLYGGRHIPTLLYWLSTLKGFIPRTGDVSILVINDDAADTLPQKSEKGVIDPGHLSSAVAMISAVNPASYAVQMTSFASLDTSRLSSFGLILLSGGLNPRPFDDPEKRSALVRYSLNGGRIVVEGGEVGYFYRKDREERDADFRRHVLHDSSFVSDAPEAELVCGTGGLFSAPNVLPATIRFAPRSSFADRDAMTFNTSEPGTFALGGWSGTPATAGIIVHVTPQRTVNTLFLPFAVASISDSSVNAALVQNVLAFVFGPVETAVTERPDAVPFGFGLEQNYPNPFNGISNFGFRISEFADVTLQVFDLLGREVARLVDEHKAPGEYTVSFDAGKLASGMYVYRLTAGNSVATRRMILMR